MAKPYIEEKKAYKKAKRKFVTLWKTIGIICLVLGVFGLLEVTGILSGVPILAYGLPAVLSCYFDLFSGFVQALVFSLLTMVYVGGACPPPEEIAEAREAKLAKKAAKKAKN